LLEFLCHNLKLLFPSFSPPFPLTLALGFRVVQSGPCAFFCRGPACPPVSPLVSSGVICVLCPIVEGVPVIYHAQNLGPLLSPTTPCFVFLFFFPPPFFFFHGSCSGCVRPVPPLTPFLPNLFRFFYFPCSETGIFWRLTLLFSQPRAFLVGTRTWAGGESPFSLSSPNYIFPLPPLVCCCLVEPFKSRFFRLMPSNAHFDSFFFSFLSPFLFFFFFLGIFSWFC